MFGKIFKGLAYSVYAGVHSYSSTKRIKKEAESGDPYAQIELGRIYGDRDSGVYNMAMSAMWFCKAAEQGNEEAQHWLGFLYSGGYGVPKNPQEALKWYRRAAEQGHELAAREAAELERQITGNELNQ
jgi:TPR repeat protein